MLRERPLSEETKTEPDITNKYPTFIVNLPLFRIQIRMKVTMFATTFSIKPMQTPGIYILILSLLCSCQSNDKIIFTDNLGHTISAADLADYTGEVTYEIRAEHTVQAAAKQLHVQPH